MRYCCLAILAIFASSAQCAAVPEWLPADLRFEVKGSSNEIQQVESTLAAMRDSISPKTRQFLDNRDLLGSYIQWLVRWSRPGVTNENVYLSMVAQDDVFSVADFNREVLVQGAANVNYMPPAVKLSFVYDDTATYNWVAHTEPGVDFPGIAAEDEGSAPHELRLVLRAPKRGRHFRVRAEAYPSYKSAIEFKFVNLRNGIGIPGTDNRRDKTSSWVVDIHADFEGIARSGDCLVAVFARVPGQFWGPPSFIRIAADPLCKHEYYNGQIYSIDYGKFKDFYNLDEKNRIMGFKRHIKADMTRQDFSNQGEYVVEFHSNDTPKIARAVRYFLDKDGRLDYEVSTTNITYKLAPMQFRPFDHF